MDFLTHEYTRNRCSIEKTYYSPYDLRTYNETIHVKIARCIKEAKMQSI